MRTSGPIRARPVWTNEGCGAGRAPARRGARASAALLAAAAATGCEHDHSAILNPSGPVALGERNLLLLAAALMLLIVLPVIAMTVWFAWRFRASRPDAEDVEYEPEWARSSRVELAMWLTPAVFVAALAVLVWRSSHALDPYRPLDSPQPPLVVQAVALDWKWLFIYPDEHIATVNELVFPQERPLSLRLTSDSVMNSLTIPGLAGQIYAMAGMETRLNLAADRQGDFIGRNMQYSGAGFPGQSFKVVTASPDDYAAWLARVRASPDRLDEARYRALRAPQANAPTAHFGSVEPGLFDKIIAAYRPAPIANAPPSDPPAADPPAARSANGT
jgi:cytochrome o ubiquinol oxidase subunit 2